MEFINFIKDHIITTTEGINAWFEKSQELRNYRPQNGGWTINEILEHISLTSHFLLKLIDKGGAKALKNANYVNLKETLKDYQFDDSKLTDIGVHKSFTWIRPEHMEPKGDVNLEDVFKAINEQKDRCLAWLNSLSNGEGVLIKTTMTVNNLGKIDVYQYIYFLSQHAQRHINQMRNNELEYEKGILN